MSSIKTKKYSFKNVIHKFLISLILIQITFGFILICPIVKNKQAAAENLFNNNNRIVYDNNKIEISSRQIRLRNNYTPDNWYNNNCSRNSDVHTPSVLEDCSSIPKPLGQAQAPG